MPLVPLVAAAGLAIVLSGTAGCQKAASQESRPKGAPVETSKKMGPKVPVTAMTAGTEITHKLSKSGYDITPLAPEEVKKLAARLTPEAYRVTQKAGTEPPFCGNLLDNHKEGIYTCVVCGLPLFSSAHKFNSGTGWPSFYQEFDPGHAVRHVDSALGMTRTEITCARCGAHLGHVFEDGPRPTGERHCLNSASLGFVEKGAPLPAESQPAKAEKVEAAAKPGRPEVPVASEKGEVAYFAAGCFWGVQHYFKLGPGVLDAVSGYAQGHVDHVTYKQVCNGETGHAETVKVVYDPKRISYRRLLEAFFVMHDPTQMNRQGPDWGEQYRSGIWTTSAEQQKEAEAFVKEQAAARRFGDRKIVTQIEPLRNFWPAEEYHQDYIAKNGASCHVKNPW